MLTPLSDFNQNCIFSTGFHSDSDIIFHKNPSSGSRVCPCGRGEGGKDGHMNENDQANSRFFEKLRT
jgi:hypothetical protein